MAIDLVAQALAREAIALATLGGGGGVSSFTDLTNVPVNVSAVGAAVGAGADKFLYWTSASAATFSGVTAAGRTLLEQIDAASQRSTLGLTIGTHVLGMGGGQLTGALYLSGTPSASNEAVGKGYVDTAIAGVVGGAPAWSSITSIPAVIDAIDGLTVAADKAIYYTGASAATTYDLTSFGRTLAGSANAAAALSSIGAAKGDGVHYPQETFIVAVGDETTAITTGTAKVTWRMPYAFTLTAVRASLTTASSSGIPTVDINEAGSTILSTKLTVDQGEKTSTTAATAAVISDTSLADDAEMTIDIDVAGTGAAGLKVYLIGYRT